MTLQRLDDFQPALKFFNLLSSCSNADITIHTTLRELVIADSWWHGVFRNMHGFRDVKIVFEQGSEVVGRSVSGFGD